MKTHVDGDQDKVGAGYAQDGCHSKLFFGSDTSEGLWLRSRDRNTARATLGKGSAVSAFPRYVPV
jgi:hypothetical protein